ncbi:CBS domain-containing protein [Actinomycetospora lemnae]|uniref:CBS domain-containing protein n=1 Tax=Actinomycetospora lemnae TaxID=3019891 RepID=A0ABT5T2M5_9PSEU|nr:CBS domain-containing protein [Actinomycetospora sp. DW7H6]MDD7969373.1 CBS domain-containing protein [Actinomycetospora sp. DW7H6]
MTTTRSGPQDPAPRLRPSRPVRVVTEQTSVAEALRVMRVAGVRHLPVIAGDRCTGLLVDRDLIAAAVDGVTEPVGRLVRGPVPTVEAGTTAAHVARAVLAGGLDAAVVVEEGTVVGIVTTTDALVALAHLDED